MMHPTDVTTLVDPAGRRRPHALRKAGFTVDLQPMDWQTLVTRRASQKPPAEGGWNMFFTNWVIPEVWNPVVNPMLNGRGKTGAWFGWPDDPELEKMRAEFVKAKIRRGAQGDRGRDPGACLGGRQLHPARPVSACPRPGTRS